MKNSYKQNSMKKLLIGLGIMSCLIGESMAQNISQYTMWNQNHYLINPAAAGNQNYFDAALGFRRQWAGVKDAPRTFYATAHSVLNRPKTHERSALRISSLNRNGVYKKSKSLSKPMVKHALGGSVVSSEFGAFESNEAMLTYALHLPIYKDISLSFGLSGGLNNFGFNQSKATVIQENDPTYAAYVAGENANQLNINAGTYLYSDKFFFGYSAQHLLQNELQLADISTNPDGGIVNFEIYHYLMGGYNFDLTNDFRLSPNILFKQLGNNPASFDLNATLTFKQFIYGGLTYRSEDAISIMGGIQINHLLRMGYAYDYTTSDLNERSNGSHEIFLGVTLF
ncbi:MAG: hypothetical protein CMO34_03175 [Verrucomicrobia bacterium]|nr:hypothetical protein [Verrucomicrobiota bacterium]|tara:strand:- start:551 stop:1570 length:1020 start_codon:yes stop_codon:yes gene_type:complete